MSDDGERTAPSDGTRCPAQVARERSRVAIHDAAVEHDLAEDRIRVAADLAALVHDDVAAVRDRITVDRTAHVERAAGDRHGTRGAAVRRERRVAEREARGGRNPGGIRGLAQGGERGRERVGVRCARGRCWAPSDVALRREREQCEGHHSWSGGARLPGAHGRYSRPRREDDARARSPSAAPPTASAITPAPSATSAQAARTQRVETASLRTRLR